MRLTFPPEWTDSFKSKSTFWPMGSSEDCLDSLAISNFPFKPNCLKKEMRICRWAWVYTSWLTWHETWTRTILRHTNHTDDGFISKDCGSMFTEEEFAAFLAKQAADLAEFAITNREFYHHFREKVFAGGPKTDEATTSVPACGLLTCNKRFKRDVDFRYNTLPSAPNWAKNSEIPWLLIHLNSPEAMWRSGS